MNRIILIGNGFDKAHKSFELRKESKRLSNLAKTMVETAIEKGEDAAMKSLNQ